MEIQHGKTRGSKLDYLKSRLDNPDVYDPPQVIERQITYDRMEGKPDPYANQLEKGLAQRERQINFDVSESGLEYEKNTPSDYPVKPEQAKKVLAKALGMKNLSWVKTNDQLRKAFELASQLHSANKIQLEKLGEANSILTNSQEYSHYSQAKERIESQDNWQPIITQLDFLNYLINTDHTNFIITLPQEYKKGEEITYIIKAIKVSSTKYVESLLTVEYQQQILELTLEKIIISCEEIAHNPNKLIARIKWLENSTVRNLPNSYEDYVQQKRLIYQEMIELEKDGTTMFSGHNFAQSPIPSTQPTPAQQLINRPYPIQDQIQNMTDTYTDD